MAANEQQLEAINSNDRTILCLSGAGSGKTFCLINRVKRLVNDNVDPSSILALTFTNAAAFEMSERFKREMPTCNPCPEFRTFHSFAYSLIVKDKEVRIALGYTKIPDICEDSEYKKLMTEAKLQLSTSLSMEALENDPNPLWTMKQKHEYETFHLLVNKLMKSKNLITFEQLNNSLSDLFASKQPCIEKYHHKYTHLLIDETQDTDEAQMKFLNSFPDTTNFFLVGDALQNIYQFRNCTNKYVKLLSANPDWKHIKLYKNYRSTRQICNFANKFSRYADSTYRIEMEGQRDGDEVEVIYGANSNYIELVDNAHMHKLIQMLKTSSEGGAVLCRTNKEVAYIKDRLKQEGIAFVSKKTDSDEVFSILRAAQDDEFALNWVAAQLNSGCYTYYIRKSQITPMTLDDIAVTFKSDSNVCSLVRKIQNVKELLETDLLVTKKKFEEILRVLKVFAEWSDDVTDDKLADYIKDHVQEQLDSELYVGTIHSSKGLEYTHVYLMGVDDRSFPIDSEEMKNLYYVGCTRAREHLTVFRR